MQCNEKRKHTDGNYKPTVSVTTKMMMNGGNLQIIVKTMAREFQKKS